MSRSERGRRTADVVRGALAVMFTTAVAGIWTADDAAAAAAPVSPSTARELAVVALGVVLVCLAVRASVPRLSRTAVVAMTGAMGLVVGGEVAALAAVTLHGDATTAGALLAALGFTAWFGYGVATAERRTSAWGTTERGNPR